jgi:hypothetical protein
MAPGWCACSICPPPRRHACSSSRNLAAVASFWAAVLTEIYLCNVCSCQEIWRDSAERLRHGVGPPQDNFYHQVQNIDIKIVGGDPGDSGPRGPGSAIGTIAIHWKVCVMTEISPM